MDALSDKDLKGIIARRDRRYDGRFFFGVKTTRIYCRPICPARPKPENIVIFRSHAEAEKSGYRPCLRCRPDAAPGSKLLAGTANTVTRALRLIQSSGEAELGVSDLAHSLGVTDRHLRRLFDEHLGASPIEILVTSRLHFAKQALEETALPIAEIAFSSGFRSLRRFNEAFRDSYHTTPTAFRRRRGGAAPGSLILRLPYRTPYDWATMRAFLARHATPGVERVDGDSYVRFVPTSRGFGSLTVTPARGKDHFNIACVDLPFTVLRGCLLRLKDLLDADHTPGDLPRGVAQWARGIRVPGAYDPFETAATIVLGQLVSTAQAQVWQGKLAARFGVLLGEDRGEPVYAFPGPACLAEAPIESIGVTKGKAGAIRNLAAAVRDGAMNFRGGLPFEEAARRLLELKGIGPWTASLVAMRCLGSPDAFPESDLVIKRVLAGRLVDPTAWGTSRAYLAHCIWRDHAGVKA